jgi:predicted dehydrogenase
MRVSGFASRLEIPRVYKDWSDMLDHPEDWDALVIATYPDGTPDVLASAFRTDVPILVEKPVAWSSGRLAELANLAPNHVIVGYNRRFYHPVQRARAEVISGPPVLARLSLPEGVFPAKEGPKPYLEPFFEDSCHGLDLVRYVFGEVKLETVYRLFAERERIGGLSAVFSTERGDIIQFEGNWGSPANFALSIHRSDRRFELCPFEQAKVYEGMEIVEPSDTSALRRYRPVEVECIDLDSIDLKEKAGFVGQSNALMDMTMGRKAPASAATLEDAGRVLELCESLVGAEYRSDGD